MRLEWWPREVAGGGWALNAQLFVQHARVCSSSPDQSPEMLARMPSVLQTASSTSLRAAFHAWNPRINKEIIGKKQCARPSHA